MPGWTLRWLEPLHEGRKALLRAQLGRQGAIHDQRPATSALQERRRSVTSLPIDGGDPGSGGKGTIFVNGEKVAEGRIDKTTPFVFSADETADVGVDDATPVTEEYAERDNEFNGQIDKVTVELN